MIQHTLRDSGGIEIAGRLANWLASVWWCQRHRPVSRIHYHLTAASIRIRPISYAMSASPAASCSTLRRRTPSQLHPFIRHPRPAQVPVPDRIHQSLSRHLSAPLRRPSGIACRSLDRQGSVQKGGRMLLRTVSEQECVNFFDMQATRKLESNPL